MAEEATTTSTESEPSKDEAKDTTTATASKTFTQEEHEREISARVARERAKYAEVEGKAKKFDELQEASKTDLEKVSGERDQFKTTAESAAAENLRLRVAIDKKLPSELIDRLKGSSKEELEADADQLLKLVKPSAATSFDGGVGREGGGGPQNMNDILRRAAGR